MKTYEVGIRGYQHDPDLIKFFNDNNIYYRPVLNVLGEFNGWYDIELSEEDYVVFKLLIIGKNYFHRESMSYTTNTKVA